MKKENVLKLHAREVQIIVAALEMMRDHASEVVVTNDEQQDILDWGKQAIDEILHKIDKRMVCIN